VARKSLLQKEIQQSKPFRSASDEAVLAMLRTSDRLRGSMARMLGPAGVTFQQYNVLRILRGAGEAGLPTLSVAERMIEHTPGITGLIDRLEKKGLVERRRGADDRRVVTCYVTPAGLALLASLDPEADRFGAAVLSNLNGSEKKVLIRLLEKVRSSCPFS
jgi:DNA-binding MarR family transcriptional regulator